MQALRCVRASLVVAVLMMMDIQQLAAQVRRDDQHAEEHRLHFTHPLVAESISPDKKVVGGYRFRSLREGDTDHTWLVGAEYAFHPAFSVEVTLPVAILQGSMSHTTFGNTGVLFKFANYTFEGRGLLLGYGLDVELPTGDDAADVGSDHIFELAPVLNAGYKRGELEVVAFSKFEIPANLRPDDVQDPAFAYNVSVLYGFSRWIQGLLELDGESAIDGNSEGAVHHVTPGVKLRLLDDRDMFVGLGVSLPLSSTKEFRRRVVMALFYHF